MTGKTHLAVGTAASLLVTQPSTLKELFICIGVAIVGSVISDIDVSTSESHQTLDWILGLILAVSVLLAFAESRWSLGIFSAILNDSSYSRIFSGPSFSWVSASSERNSRIGRFFIPSLD